MKIACIFLVVMLVFVEEIANKGVCVTKMVNGKLQKYGDCDNKRQSQVLKDLDKRLEKREKYNRANSKSCKDVVKSFNKVKNVTGGVFVIYPDSIGKKVKVYCDLKTDGGGWTVFQRRMDGSEDFYRGWNDYVRGFGKKNKEFWLGLKKLHKMTKNGRYELRVELVEFDGHTSYAKYGSFSIGSSADNYRLNVASHSGTVGDALLTLNGQPFTTKDADHDLRNDINCAQTYLGAWWYHSCGYSNLNGLYRQKKGGTELWWRNTHRWEYLNFTEMKFRRVD